MKSFSRIKNKSQEKKKNKDFKGQREPGKQQQLWRVGNRDLSTSSAKERADVRTQARQWHDGPGVRATEGDFFSRQSQETD